MDSLQTEIARFLTEKAMRQARATYQQVAGGLEPRHRTRTYEVPVYGHGRRVNGAIQTLETALSPSRAIPSATEPYWVGETDGPTHLYVLELNGDAAAYLGRSAENVDGQTIINVGFSRSPSARRDQIQSAYPNDQFKWSVRFPTIVPDVASYPNARIAIVGEDAMKKRLVDEGAEVLGGEFFLAQDSQHMGCGQIRGGRGHAVIDKRYAFSELSADDYRGYAGERFPARHRGKRTVLVYASGRTELKLLEELADEEIAAKLPVHLRHLPLPIAA